MSRKRKIKVIVEVLQSNSLGIPNEKENYYLANKVLDALKELKRDGK